TDSGEARSRSPIRLTVDSPSLTVLPGGDAEGLLSIENLSTLMLGVELGVEGVDPDWTEVIPREATAFPQRQVEARVIVRAPAELDRAVAGLYPLRVRGSPREYLDQSAEAAVELEVQLVGDYDAVLEQAAGRAVRETTYPIRVRNRANAPARVRFEASDS